MAKSFSFRAATVVALALFLACPASSLGASVIEPPVSTNSGAWKGSAALFAGVAGFDTESGLGNLRYTVDDAVALAAVFADELRLLPPENVWLVLSGQSTNELTRAKLARLKRLGVREVPAQLKSLREAVRAAAKAASDADGLLVMSFSTHGYELRGTIRLMPSDGEASDVENTGLSLSWVKETMQNSPARKRLLLIDACRQTEFSATRSDERMPEAFYNALRSSSGFGMLVSCNKGQRSWEDEKLGHGVFTHFVMEALRGKATADPRTGFIHLREVANYATSQTKDWVWRVKSSEQDPWFNGETPALDIPLGMDPQQRDKARELRRRGVQALHAINEARANHPNVMDGDTLSLLVKLFDTKTGPELERLVAKCEEVDARKGDKPALEDLVAWLKGRYAMVEPAPVRKEPVAPATPLSATPVPAAASARKPAISIQFDPASQRTTRLWTTTRAAQFRDLLAQGLRDRNAFDVRTVAAMNNRRPTANTPAGELDYVLTIRVDQYDHKLEANEKSFGPLRINLATYTPITTLRVGWGIQRLADNSEVKTDSAASSAQGKPMSSGGQDGRRVNPATLERQAEWRDDEVVRQVAEQMAAQISGLNLRP